jgi:hypothetical protein
MTPRRNDPAWHVAGAFGGFQVAVRELREIVDLDASDVDDELLANAVAVQRRADAALARLLQRRSRSRGAAWRLAMEERILAAVEVQEAPP